MTKPIFRPRGRPDKSISFSHNKNVKRYRTANAHKGLLSDNNCQDFNSNSKISFFQEKCLNRT